MKQLHRISLILVLVLAVSSTGSFACTAVYVGKEVSTDGSTIIARSEDQANGAYNKMFVVVPGVNNQPGRVMEDVNGCKIQLPATTYKYTMVPDNRDGGDGPYPGACTNEFGLAISGTVTTYVNDKALAADPEVENGIREAILPGALAATCRTAGEGVARIGEYMKKYGSAEHNIVMLVDPKEAWYVEIYTGHQWAAMKMPTDQVAVFGNETMLQTIDLADKENYRASASIFKLALDNGFAVKEKGKVHLAKSYSAPREDWAHMRTWYGQKLLAPSKSKDYNLTTFLPLFIKPDKPVSALDVMNLLRSRYEGTDFDKKLKKNRELYAIGNETQSQIHVLQTQAGVPAAMATLQWLALGNAEHSVFLPSFSNIQGTHPAYQVDGGQYDPAGAYWKFKRLDALSEQNRTRFGKGVQKTWQLTEKFLYAQMQTERQKIAQLYAASPEQAAAYSTKLAADIAQDAMDTADVMFDDLFFYMMDQTGMLQEDRLPDFEGMLALKPFAVYKGYRVQWDGQTRTVALTKGKQTYNLKVGDCEYTGTGSTGQIAGELSQAPQLVKGKVFVPYTFIEKL